MKSPQLKWPTIQHLRDMNVFESEPCPLRHALLVH
jgi:hypothetical protein